MQAFVVTPNSIQQLQNLVIQNQGGSHNIDVKTLNSGGYKSQLHVGA